MTTIPTASPELPDLDRLEALARAATPGEWKAMPYGRIVGGPLRHYVNGSAPAQIASFGVTFHEQAPEDEPERQQANAEFAAAANPAAILQLIQLARRAALANQPAPTDWQAAHADMVKRNALLRERPDLPADRIPAHAELVRLQEENARLRANQPAPTVPALDDLMTYPSPHGTLVRLADVKCRVAHQPAQEQAEPSTVCEGCDDLAGPSGVCQACIDFANGAAQQEPAAAPQQAEAPEQFCDANCVWTDHHKDCTISAPGTPEAPLDPGQVQSIADRVRNTAGIPRAAQLDGGKEGSAT